METKFKYLLYGTLAGVFLTGLTVVLIGVTSNNQQIDKTFNSIDTSSYIANNSTACMDTVIEIDSNSPMLDINLSSFDELTSLPGIGEVKAKNIIDFREKYGNFVSVDELLYVPGIGESLFQQICNLVAVNPKDKQ